MTEGTDAYDIFLSYARLDNEEETDDKSEAGWVDHFQARLIKQLRRRGRPDVGFWRDVAEIAGADRFAPQIVNGLAHSHFFMPVLSRNYVQRPWCRQEVERFGGRRAKEPATDDRIVPIYKLPLEKQLIPELLRGRGGITSTNATRCPRAWSNTFVWGEFRMNAPTPHSSIRSLTIFATNCLQSRPTRRCRIQQSRPA